MPVLMALMMSGQVFRLREDVASPGLKLQTIVCVLVQLRLLAGYCMPQITEKESFGLMVTLLQEVEKISTNLRAAVK